jgi:soluble lytic murein transglycosylase-like protein
VDAYPEQEYGAASLRWLIRNAPARDAGRLAALATDISGQSYYAQRVRHHQNGIEPFVSAGAANLYAADTGRDFTESWLREWLGLGGQQDVASLSDKLAQDARLVRGDQLWQLGRRAEATVLFESLRSEYTNDALASYQLALYFRDLGLYRSSLLAASTVMVLAGVGVSGAPRFLARLAYPAYYADLVSAEAQRYGFDPLLQLALTLEESFFDTLATSPAGARGLSQILPEPGSYIAGQLSWPGYTNSDLYRPEVAIPFGAYFLDQQLDRYDGNVAAALAAYNAGPGFADGWYELESDDFDLFLETVDFPETQRYIKQIYTVHAIYRFLYS